jgi:hypothetical protein
MSVREASGCSIFAQAINKKGLIQHQGRSQEPAIRASGTVRGA